MPLCPECQASIPERDFQSGICSACGGMLRADDATTDVTVPMTDESSTTDSPSPETTGDETIPVTVAMTSQGTMADNPEIRASIDFSQEFDGDSSIDTGGGDSLNLSESIHLESDSGPPGSGSGSGVGGRSTKTASRVSPETQLVIQTREIRKMRDGSSTMSRESSLDKAIADDPNTRYDYEFLGKIGEGGMGVVYKARQGSVGREVAVKMLHPKRAADPLLRDSFLSEAVVNGDLDHPNIVPVYDLGKDRSEGLFYAMKQIKGRNWDKDLLTKKLSENLEILMKVADAIAFAHSHGVVHRDLKPENVVIGDYGEVFVVDWGVARVMPGHEKANGIIGSDGLWGTPAYAAPEILTGPLDAIGPHSDVYLLGALLYEIVTGFPPHYGRTVSECKAAAKLNEIRPTDRTGELVDIARKAMETDPADRYPNVQAFQQAVRDYQSHSESIVLAQSARTDLELAKKSGDYKVYNRAIAVYEKALELWKDNHAAQAELPQAKLAYATCALGKGDFELGLSLAEKSNPAHRDVIARLTSAQAERASRQRRLTFFRRATVAASLVAIGFAGWAEVQRQEAVKQTGIANTANANLTTANEKLADTNKELEKTNAELKVANDAKDKANRDLTVANAEKDKANTELMVANSKLEKALNDLTVANAATEKANGDLKVANGKLEVANKTLDEKNVELAQANKDLMVANEAEKKATAEAQRQAAIARYEAFVAQIGAASAKVEENAFDAVRDLLNSPSVKDFRSGWEVRRLEYLSNLGEKVDFGTQAESVAVDSRGQRFVIAGQEGKAVVHKFDEPREAPGLALADKNQSTIQSVAFTTDDQYITAARRDGTISVWDAGSGQLVRTLSGTHSGAVNSVAFATVGAGGSQWMLTSSDDKTVQVWNASGSPDAWRPSGAPLKGHYSRVSSAVFSPDASRIVSVGDDGRAVVWESKKPGSEPYQQQVEYSDHACALFAAAFRPGTGLIATAGFDGRIRIWDPSKTSTPDIRERTQNIVRKNVVQDEIAHNAPVHALRFSADGNYLLSAADDNTVKVWKFDSPTQMFLLDKTLRGHGGWVRDCRVVASANPTDVDLKVVSASHDRSARVWSIAKYEDVRTIGAELGRRHDDQILAAAFDRTGSRIITSSRDRTARVWQVDNPARPITELKSDDIRDVLKEGHKYLVSSAVYFPDGKQVVTAGIDGQAIGWDVRSGAMLWQLRSTGLNAAVAVTSEWIATGSNDHLVKMWKISNGAPAESFIPLDRHPGQSSVSALAFSPDGRLLYSGASDGSGMLWELKEGAWVLRAQLTEGHARHVNVALFVPGRGDRLLTGSDDGSVLQWNVADGRKLNQLTLSLNNMRAVSLAATPDGKSALALGAPDATLEKDANVSARRHVLRKWDLDNPASFSDIEIKDEFAVTSLTLSPDGKLAITAISNKAGDETGLIWWNLQTRTRIDSIIGKKRSGIFWSAIFAPADPQREQTILTLGGDKASIWTAETGALRMTFGPQGSIASASFSSDGKYALTGGSDQSVKIWDIERKQVLLKLARPHRGRITAALFSPAAGSLNFLTAGNDGSVKVWQWNGPEAQPTMTHEFTHSDEVIGAAISPDGRHIATACADNQARIWDLQNPEKPLTLSGHKDKVLAVAFSANDKRFGNPAGLFLATASEDNTAIVWDAQTGKQLTRPLEGHSAGVTSVAFYGNGDRLITGSKDATARVWDPRLSEIGTTGELLTGREVLTLTGHSTGLTSVSFSPDGRFALTAGDDGNVILYLTREPRSGETERVTLLTR
jgi:WD40 repeat protein/serine/threonine protein kinase